MSKPKGTPGKYQDWAIFLRGDGCWEGWDSFWSPPWQGWGLSVRGSWQGYGSTGQQPAAIPAEHASPRKPLNSKGMTKQQLIEKVAAKTELKKSEVEAAVDSRSEEH